MDQWDFASGLLLPNEKVVVVQNHIRLYNGDEKIKSKSDTGRITLTTHRLLWETPSLKASFNLGRVTKLDKESKGFTSVFSGKSPKIVLHTAAPTNQSKTAAVSPFANERHASYFKLGFTQGGLEEFLGKLTDTLRQREWEKRAAKPEPKIRLGILGIERAITDEAKKTDQQISEAFHDLKSLVEMAKPMVQLAKKISDKASKKQISVAGGGNSSGGATSEVEDTVKFRKQLLSLGIDDPVTRDSYSSKDEYHLHLAMEMCTALDKLVLDAGGMMTLVEAYCRLNRARGVHVISPHDLMGACQMLKRVPSGTLFLREFDTKVKVLQHHSYDDQLVLAQINSLLDERGSLTPDEFAHALGIPLFVSKQGLIMAETHGELCRDESVEGLRFYPNIFVEDIETNEGNEAS